MPFSGALNLDQLCAHAAWVPVQAGSETDLGTALFSIYHRPMRAFHHSRSNESTSCGNEPLHRSVDVRRSSYLFILFASWIEHHTYVHTCSWVPLVEMALHVLAYTLTRVLNIVGVKPLIAAMRA